MKKTLMTLALLAMAGLVSAQTIHRVNTNPSVTGLNVYGTIQAAHDAASPGDVIIVEASSISCGDLVATKSLKIYGKGYYTGTNNDLHVSPDPSLASDITLEPSASNTEISGLTMQYVYIQGASNVRFYRNRVFQYLYVRAENSASTDVAVSNIQISQNYLHSYLYINSTTQGISTVSVTNNHVNYISNSASNISGLVINNNTIQDYVSLNNATVQNNIFYGTSTSSSFNGCTITNNVARGNETDLLAGTDNLINNTDLTSATTGFLVAIAAALPTGTSEDERWQIKDGSPLKTHGAGGIEVGMYGGPNPYVPSGIPAAPAIIKLITPDYGNTAAPLPVTISIKSNN